MGLENRESNVVVDSEVMEMPEAVRVATVGGKEMEVTGAVLAVLAS